MARLTKKQLARAEERIKQLESELAAEKNAVAHLGQATSSLLKRAETAESELAEARAALERDRTKVAECVTAVQKELHSYDWLISSRGSYEWDDDRWHGEFKTAHDAILEAISPMVKIAADWSHCPKSWDEVQKARNSEARAQTAAMLEKLKLLATEVHIDHNGSGLPFSGYDSCHKHGFDTCTSPKCVSIRALITADQSSALREIRAEQAAMLEKAATVKIYDAEIPKHWSDAIRALSTADKSAALREHVERNTKPLFDEINRLQNEYISLERRFLEFQAALADLIKEARREEAEWFQKSIDDFEHASMETKISIVNERMQRLAALQPAEEDKNGS